MLFKIRSLNLSYLISWLNFNNSQITLVLILAFISTHNGLSQEFSQQKFTPEQNLELIKAKYGYDQLLVNGVYFEYQSGKDIGHPFMESEEYQKGYLIIHKKRYDNLLLKYDLFNQQVVVLYTDNIGTQLAFVPPVIFISEFAMDKLLFKRYAFNNEPAKIYQEVYSGNIKCLYAWKKGRAESHHNVKYSAFEYFKPASKSYLVIDNSIYQFRGKGDFIKLFPPTYKKEISAFIKTQNIKVNSATDKEIVTLMTFCEGLISNNSF